jgi:hypothetical protein
MTLNELEQEYARLDAEASAVADGILAALVAAVGTPDDRRATTETGRWEVAFDIPVEGPRGRNCTWWSPSVRLVRDADGVVDVDLTEATDPRAVGMKAADPVATVANLAAVAEYMGRLVVLVSKLQAAVAAHGADFDRYFALAACLNAVGAMEPDAPAFAEAAQ